MSEQQLEKFIGSRNIAEGMDDTDLSKIGQTCFNELELDDNSREDWKKKNEDGLKLARQDYEEKTYPWPGAASIKYPLITTSAIQFAARAYPEIVQGTEIVKARVIGNDPKGEKADRADRVSKHMSYQVTEEMPEWEEDMDRLLHATPIVGCTFKKTYFDPAWQRNFSKLRFPDDVIIHMKAQSIDTARRISDRLWKYKNDIYEHQASRMWLDIDLKIPDTSENDTDAPEEFIEQHRYLDLDDDGYSEPYIVTFHKRTKKVVRIVARYDRAGVEYQGTKLIRIKPIQYFTKFPFIPDPAGGFYDLGLSQLLGPINEAVNTVLNELLDAANLSNAGGGFIGRGIRIKGGKIEIIPGKWQYIESTGDDLRKNLVPYPVNEPSQVLFLLLGLLIDAGKDISSVKDVLTGEKPGENVSVETVLALAEQGLKVFSGIFKRIYRSLKGEFNKLYRLNYAYLNQEQYFTVLDNEQAIKQADYTPEGLDISPVAEPSMSLDVLRLAKARALRESVGMPGIKPLEVTKRWLKAIKADNLEEIFDPNWTPQPDQKVVELMARLDMDKEKQPAEMATMQAEIQKLIAEIEKIKADATLSLVKAGTESVKPALEGKKIDAMKDKKTEPKKD